MESWRRNHLPSASQLTQRDGERSIYWIPKSTPDPQTLAAACVTPAAEKSQEDKIKLVPYEKGCHNKHRSWRRTTLCTSIHSFPSQRQITGDKDALCKTAMSSKAEDTNSWTCS